MTSTPRLLVLAATFAATSGTSLLARPTLASAESSSFRRAHSCGTRHQPGMVASPIQRAGGGPRTVYLNRFGGTYHITSGATNASTQTANRSVSADGRSREATIAPLAAGFDWNRIASCVRAHFDRYDLRIVESRPTSGVYIEAVVGGDGTELGFSRDDLFGIASADNFCGVTEAGIAFNFSETHRNVPQQDNELCATIAHEVGHLLALEHETLAGDLMSYVLVSETPSKAFVNQSSQCGVYPGEPSRCSCTQDTTNSAARLTSFVGLRPVESVPPSLSVVSPGDGDSVPPSFEVVAEASDNLEMSDVSVILDGQPAGADVEPEGNRYVIGLTGLADGDHALTVRALDRAGNEKRIDLSITVARLPIGEACTDGDQCAGRQCVAEGSEQYCSQECDPAGDTCPDGWSCTAAGSISVCAGGAGGCCSAGDRPGAGTWLVVLGVGFVVIRRRRRSAAT